MVKYIAILINVPQAYLDKLMQELSKQNLISSTRGPNADFKKSILESFRDKSIEEYAAKIQKTNRVISLKDVNILNND